MSRLRKGQCYPKLSFQKGWRLITLFFLTSLINAASAQDWPSDLWHDGKIVLEQGDTLRGQVKYDLQQDLLQFKIKNEKVEAYSARKVMFFEIFDNTINRYRNFFSLPYNKTSSYLAPVFFELLEEGKLTLLSRENLEYKTYSSPYYVGSYSRLVMVYRFYFLNEKGEITEFVGTKNDLLNLMGRKSEDVEKYIKTNRLKVEEKYDFARIVAYYNSLF